MPAPTPAAAVSSVNEAAETQALIKQITSEARASGQSIAFDPDAAVTDEDADAKIGRPRPAKDGKGAKPAKDGKTERGKDGKFQPKDGKGKPKAADEDETEETDEETDAEPAADDDEETEGEETDETEETDEDKPEPGQYDGGAIQAALDAEGGVDMLALAKALGKTPEELGVGPGQHKALRMAQKKASKTLARANTLAEELKAEFGDRVAARRAVTDGDLDAGIQCCEAIFDMSWNELNKAISAKLAGKPLPDIEKKRLERKAKQEAADKEAADKKASEEKAKADKTEQAKTWITTKIKGDPLASKDMAKLLSDAGLPSITELVFQELQAGYSRGLTDPKKALEKVRAKLQKQAKALAAGGLVPQPKPKTEPKPAVRQSPPRGEAQRGAAGNSREMTDAEMRRAVLKEAGLGAR